MVPHPVSATTAARQTDRVPARRAVPRFFLTARAAPTPMASARKATVQIWASLVAAKHRQTAVVAPIRGHVHLRAVQISEANIKANRLIEIDSDSSDRFQRVTGKAVAKARIAQTAATRLHPGSTSRPTVNARKPQQTAAISAWVARKPPDEPTSLISSDVRGGRSPAQNPPLPIDRDAMRS